MKFLLILLSINLANASTYKIAGEFHEFTGKDDLLVYGCDKNCDALKAVKKNKKINLTKIRRGEKYINSVGSDVCSKVYKAKSILGINEDKDGRAFCVFKDKSMIEINSLSTYLKEKKIVSE